jgi:2-polyprenyl-6-methoxyphenol hydroxylase-like FAD-dependent oxidoreductase
MCIIHIGVAHGRPGYHRRLICGAGAAGLTLAIDLARRGVSFRLIDKLPRRSPARAARASSRAPWRCSRISASSTPVRDRRLPIHRSAIHHEDGRRMTTAGLLGRRPTPQEPFRAPLMVPQFRTEAVMRDRLAEFGQAPEYGHELTAFEQDADHVVAQIASPGGARKRSAAATSSAATVADPSSATLWHRFPWQDAGRARGRRRHRARRAVARRWHRFNDGEMARQLVLLPPATYRPVPAPGADRARWRFRPVAAPACRRSSTIVRPAMGSSDASTGLPPMR